MLLAPNSRGSAWSAAVEKVERLGRDIVGALPNVAIGLIVFGLFYLAGRAVRSLIRRAVERRRRYRNVALVLGRLGQGGMFVLGVLVACVIVFPRFTPASLLQLLGIGSVAIGFAFRDILQNYLAGILLLLTEPFRIGDQIVFKGYEGTVEDIQTRATALKTYDGRRVVIPNAELFTNSVLVNTAFELRRLEYDVGMGFGEDIDRVKALILEAVSGAEGVLADPAPDVLAMEIGQSSIYLRARWWIKPPRIKDALDSRDAVIAAIKKKLDESGVALPLPTTEVLLQDRPEGGGDGAAGARG